jgi:hypothetical protein
VKKILGFLIFLTSITVEAKTVVTPTASALFTAQQETTIADLYAQLAKTKKVKKLKKVKKFMIIC